MVCGGGKRFKASACVRTDPRGHCSLASPLRLVTESQQLDLLRCSVSPLEHCSSALAQTLGLSQLNSDSKSYLGPQPVVWPPSGPSSTELPLMSSDSELGLGLPPLQPFGGAHPKPGPLSMAFKAPLESDQPLSSTLSPPLP